jgi:predicted N-acetyltransferase YhbS
MIIERLNTEHAQFIADHQQMYPKAMWEDASEFATILASTDFSFGAFADGALVGWILCSSEDPESAIQIYWYDLAVLESHHGQGIGKSLMQHAYRELRWKGQWIRMHTRRATYPRSEEGLRRSGYRIVRDVFLPHHYLEEYGIDEDAHELLLSPI